MMKRLTDVVRNFSVVIYPPFEAVAGQTYDIKTGNLEECSDTIIALYDGDCKTRLAENDNISWPTNVASQIVWTPTESGWLHVMVWSYDWRVYGEDTGYTASVEEMSDPALGNVDRPSRRSPGLASFVEQPESGVESTENENSDAGTDVEGVILGFGAVSALVLFFTGVLVYNAISVIVGKGDRRVKGS